jgi:hypothetical protein
MIAEKPHERPMYDKYLVYGGVEEYSFEEIRAIKHLKRMKQQQVYHRSSQEAPQILRSPCLDIGTLLQFVYLMQLLFLSPTLCSCHLLARWTTKYFAFLLVFNTLNKHKSLSGNQF